MIPWSFRLPEDLLDRFKAAADAEERSTAGELRRLMAEKVAEHEASERQPVASGKAA